MEDFRNKIKGYKAEPNDASWERMQIKKEKKKLNKYKGLLFLFLGLNLMLLAYQVAFPKTEIEAASTNINTQEPVNIEQYTNEIASQKSLHTSLQNEINNLKNSIADYKNKLQFKTDQISNLRKGLANKSSQIIYVDRPVTVEATTSPQTITSKEENNVVNLANQNFLNNLPNIISNNHVHSFLLELVEKNKNPKSLSFNQSIYEEEKIKNWYAILGLRYHRYSLGSQRDFNIGFARRLHRRFDLGLLFNFYNTNEQGQFKTYNEVRDRRSYNQATLFLRYKAVQLNKFTLFADAGIGYRLGTNTQRQGRMVNNELNYYNDTSRYNYHVFQYSLGVMYDISPRVNLSSSFHIGEDSNVNLNLNYRF